MFQDSHRKFKSSNRHKPQTQTPFSFCLKALPKRPFYSHCWVPAGTTLLTASAPQHLWVFMDQILGKRLWVNMQKQLEAQYLITGIAGLLCKECHQWWNSSEEKFDMATLHPMVFPQKSQVILIWEDEVFLIWGERDVRKILGKCECNCCKLRSYLAMPQPYFKVG